MKVCQLCAVDYTLHHLLLPLMRAIAREGHEVVGVCAEGERLEPVPDDNRRLGVLICEDLWHPGLARRLAVGGMKILLVMSAGPGRLGPGDQPESQEVWEVLTRSTALVNTCWVLYCNRVGWEEGSFYAGGSHIVRPGGEVLERAGYLDEELLIARIDQREVDRVRWRLPLVHAVRDDIQGPNF